MNIGSWVLYEATHMGSKKTIVGQVRWVEPNWVDTTVFWTNNSYDHLLYNTATLMRSYCTPITKEVADVIIKSNQEKE